MLKSPQHGVNSAEEMVPLAVVLDTNVVVSAALKPQGREALVLTLALAGKFRLFLSPSVLKEYEKVLPREKLRLEASEISDLMGLIRGAGRLVSPARQITAASDPEDNRFLECAETAGADFLVTGNQRHFPKRWGKTRVVNARELLEIIGPELMPSPAGGPPK